MDMEEGGKYNELSLNLKPSHYRKFMKKDGFQLTPDDLANDSPERNKVSMKTHGSFHKRYRHAIKHKKNLRILKSDYEDNLTGEGIKKEKKESIELPMKTKKDNVKASLQPDHLLIPNGTLLRGVPVQGRGEYKVPLATDVHSFAIRKRTKKD